MPIPNLKRIKVSTEQDLRNWLAKNADAGQVLIVTCDKKSPTKHIPSETVRGVLQDQGWVAGPSYTLPGNLVGHVAKLG